MAKTQQQLQDEVAALRYKHIGQYRVTYTLYGPFVEIFIAENARRGGHWRLVSGKKREAILAEAEGAK